MDNLKHLSEDRQSFILKSIKKYKETFHGTLGNYTGSEYKIELLEGVKSYHAKPFLISKIHEETLK